MSLFIPSSCLVRCRAAEKRLTERRTKGIGYQVSRVVELSGPAAVVRAVES